MNICPRKILAKYQPKWNGFNIKTEAAMFVKVGDKPYIR